MKTLSQLICEKCGYRWFQRTPSKPVKCPECQSRRWDEKQNKIQAMSILQGKTDPC